MKKNSKVGIEMNKHLFALLLSFATVSLVGCGEPAPPPEITADMEQEIQQQDKEVEGQESEL